MILFSRMSCIYYTFGPFLFDKVIVRNRLKRKLFSCIVLFVDIVTRREHINKNIKLSALTLKALSKVVTDYYLFFSIYPTK